MRVPSQLASNCSAKSEWARWLERLPALIGELRQRWAIETGEPFEDASAAWVAPAVRADGSSAVIKIGMPHMEAEQEIDGLRFWKGDATVRLLKGDVQSHAMLIERCEPGTPLRQLPEPEQDVVIAGMLKRLSRVPPQPHPFRPLSEMLDYWSAETLAQESLWPDAGLVREGLRLFQELPKTAPAEALLATDLHAGNVLQAQREPWLMIDPKPFIGDPAYDATQHLLNCPARLLADPLETIRSISDLAGLDAERVRLWTFARAAAEPRDDWPNSERFRIAIVLKP